MKIICTMVIMLGVSCSYAKDEHSVLQTDAVQKLRNSHVTFTRNDGQIDTHGKADCRFTTSVGGANYFFCADGIVSDFRLPILDFGLEEERPIAILNPKSKIKNPKSIKGHVLKLNFLARTNFLPEITGQDEQEYKCNYFIGNDASKWHTNVPNYSRVMYKDVWEGIDVVYRSASCQLANAISRRDLTSRATLEYDVIIHPGADPNQIQFSYEGQEGLSIDSKGNLVLKTSVGDVIEQVPYVYQIIDGVKKEISSQFVLNTSVNQENYSFFTFVIGNYDKAKELIIDPVYSTFLGGNSNDNAYAIAIDAGGNAYITGSSESSNFPKTVGAYDTTNFQGQHCCFVTKLNAAGSALIYSTFLGGTYNGTLGLGYNVSSGSGIAVDASGNAFITGYTNDGFPTTPGAFQTTFSGSGLPNYSFHDAFVTKLNATGSGLIYSTYLGGLSDDKSNSIAIDSSGCAYVAGSTSPYEGGANDFPFTVGAYQPAAKGDGPNAFITKLKPKGDSLAYSTFLGGAVNGGTNGTTVCNGIAIDRYGNAYVAGTTDCFDFPTTDSAFQTVQLLKDYFMSAFMTKFNTTGSALLYSTYLSRVNTTPLGVAYSWVDRGSGIAVDNSGNAFVVGSTYASSSNGNYFPTTAGAFATQVGAFGGGFMSKLKPEGHGIKDLLYSTYYFGGGIAVDASGNVLVAGGILMTKLKPAGQGRKDLLDSIFLGRSIQSSSGATCIAVDVNGNAVIAGTWDSTYKTTPHAYQTTSGSNYEDAFVTKFSLVPILSVANPVTIDSVYCTESLSNVLIENLSADRALKIDTMTLSGPNAANYSFVTPPKYPIIIPALGDTQIVLQLTRVGSAGTKTAFLNIRSNDDAPLSDTLKKVTLVGMIDSIGVVTLKKNITFGQLRCEEVSFDTVIQVKNKGLQPARVVPTVSGDGATSFTVTPSSVTIAGGATGNFTVHFQPSGNGSFSAHIKFSDDACEMISDTTYITGSKISDVSLTSSPSLIDFGEHCHSSVVDSFITVHNTSNATVTLDPAVTSGNGFTVLTPTTSVTLGPDSSIQYRIRFTSTGAGNYQGRLSLNGKPCNLSVSNQLRGTEIEPPNITLNPTLVFFDTLDCSETERFTKVKVKNVGTRTITLKPVIIGDTASYHARPESITILKNSSFNVRITFHPDSSGQHTAYLFFDDMLCGLLKDSVSVRGFKKSVGAITGKPLLRFDTMNCSAGERDTMSLWIKNTGDQVLNLNTPTVSGNGFVIDNANGVLGLAPGDSMEYRIIFTPNGEGTYLGTFRITGTCNVLFSCPLSGVCSYTFDVAEKGAGSAKEFFLDQNHPNPFSGLSIVDCRLSNDASFEVRDMLGRVVYQTNVSSTTTQLTIDANGWPNGLYLYSLNDGKNVQSRMMMVVH